MCAMIEDGLHFEMLAFSLHLFTNAFDVWEVEELGVIICLSVVARPAAVDGSVNYAFRITILLEHSLKMANFTF